MNKTILKKILIHTIFPLSVGIAIYYFGRDWTHLEIGTSIGNSIYYTMGVGMLLSAKK